MSQSEMKPLPENEDELVIGDDGELLEPDQNVDPSKYAQYVANFRLLPRQIVNEWDDARVAEWLGFGCVAVLIMTLVFGAFWFIRIIQGIPIIPIP